MGGPDKVFQAFRQVLNRLHVKKNLDDIQHLDDGHIVWPKLLKSVQALKEAIEEKSTSTNSSKKSENIETTKDKKKKKLLRKKNPESSHLKSDSKEETTTTTSLEEEESNNSREISSSLSEDRSNEKDVLKTTSLKRKVSESSKHLDHEKKSTSSSKSNKKSKTTATTIVDHDTLASSKNRSTTTPEETSESSHSIPELPAPLLVSPERTSLAATENECSHIKNRTDSSKKFKESFRRVSLDSVSYANERLKDNSFLAKSGADSSYGYKAHKDLVSVRGKDFRHEKTKKKKGSYRGGMIDMTVHSIKFDDD